MWVCGSRRRLSAVEAPDRTPTMARRPAFVPACRSRGVSPTVTTSATLLTRADSIGWPAADCGEQPGPPAGWLRLPRTASAIAFGKVSIEPPAKREPEDRPHAPTIPRLGRAKGLR